MFCNFISENWQTLISLFFAVIGATFALYQWRESVRNKRAEFINQILEKIRFNEELVDTMYVVTYCEEEWYNNNFHDDKKKEAHIDKLFCYVDYICYLKQTNNISKKEFEIFKYIVHRVCINNSSKKYLWNLFHFSKKNNAPCSFQRLIEYGIKSKIFSKDFKDNESLFERTINW